MILTKYHLGLRQAFMALMNWAIDVPQVLLQNDAKRCTTEELIMKKSYFIFLYELLSETR